MLPIGQWSGSRVGTPPPPPPRKVTDHTHPPLPSFTATGTGHTPAPQQPSHPWTPQMAYLQSCIPLTPMVHPSPLGAIVTPLRWQVWEAELRGHPDRAFASLIVDGIRHGFRIGFDRRNAPELRPKRRNMGSAYQHSEVVDNYLTTECQAGRVLGPFSAPPISRLQTNSFGVIPKRHQPGKWRLILDLSSPDGHSVNDGIGSEACTLNYISVQDVAGEVARRGRGSLLAKTDVKQAYRQIPVHPDDRHLLGMTWRGGSYIDAVLPFGLRSAPLIFSAVGDAIEWITKARGVAYAVHYIDDFIVVGDPGTDECHRALRTLLRTCEDLGVQTSPAKTEGPATRLTVLGIEIDSLAMTLRLPDDKRRRTSEMLGHWRGRASGNRKDLESLVGTLQHASLVVRPGKLFLRNLFRLLAGTSNFKPHFKVRLNKECRADVEWWASLLHSWNGVSLLRPLRTACPDIVLHSDASGGWGCGAYWQSLWFQVP